MLLTGSPNLLHHTRAALMTGQRSANAPDVHSLVTCSAPGHVYRRGVTAAPDALPASMPTALRFTVLGPVRAWRGDTELDLGSPQQRATLAVMLLRQGSLVPANDLVEALWGAETPRAALSTLRTYISRLRSVLGLELISCERVGYAVPVRVAVGGRGGGRGGAARARGAGGGGGAAADW